MPMHMRSWSGSGGEVTCELGVARMTIRGRPIHMRTATCACHMHAVPDCVTALRALTSSGLYVYALIDSAEAEDDVAIALAWRSIICSTKLYDELALDEAMLAVLVGAEVVETVEPSA
ncbi:MAG: hypothetical protein JWR89_2232 [Tardiphaga sp.]|nr:hypothetical protein [Tardiphaga sp.]